MSHGREGRVTLVVLGAVVFVAALIAPVAVAKKSSSKPFTEQLPVDQAILDRPPGGVSTPLRSTIEVPKKFRGRTVADVNVTNLQTSGSAAAAAQDLIAKLTAPNGRTTILFRGKGDTSSSLGPWTLDDDTPTQICNVVTPAFVCGDPLASLKPPFAGTTNLVANDTPSFVPLASFDGIKMRGTWTLTMADLVAGRTSVLNQWGLRVKPAKEGEE